uniref:Reverse transcriptase domain-containing protein n=1 Tax=Tanacetum cinerariifolium TaxID=118510 RepID=A0A6L2LEU0_TANCI|nr:reverse transcriptase domain-containing protein [Tanacetum cinerariifolium]
MPATTPLIGFNGEIIWPIGKLQLLVKIGDEDHFTSAWMNFVVVRSPSSYNGIIGRPGVRKLQAVLSTAHGMLKLLVKGGAITLKSSRMFQLERAMVSRPEGNLSDTKQTVEERIKLAINPEYPEQTIMIGSTLTEEGRNKLCDLLQCNLNIFAWKPADMIGVPRHIKKYRLNVREGCSPVREKKRGQVADRNQAIKEEVGKLVETGIMKEVHYHDWLSNPVMVKKHDDSLRIATYQRLVDKAFHKQIGRNLEVYVDDLVIKIHTEDEIVRNIEDTFKTLRKINMKLNPKKCTFGVEKGMFLGYKVNTRGLKVCPDKVDAVLSLPSPKCLNDVQKLNGLLASLNRFLANSAKKSLLFFKTLKKCTKKSEFHWTAEAEEAFKKMKQLIAKLPMLVTPMKKKELIVYLAATKETVSVDLMTERETKQMPIYFVSRALRGPEINYTSMEKLVLALVHASKRQKWYRDGTDSYKPKGMEFTYALRFSSRRRRRYLDDSYFRIPHGGNPARDVKKARAVRRPLQANYILREIHKGSCIMHAGTRSVVTKALRISYYWPTMHKDTRTLIRACQDCQVHKPVPRNPQQKLTPIVSPWSFYKWGIDIAEPFLEGHGKVKFLIVAIDYFTKKQFWDNPFKDWCEKLCICQHFASVKHPQTNGLEERANRSLGEGIKARLDARSKNWMEELSHVLWAHYMMINSSNEDTPFSLTYGTEAVIPAEISMPTLRTAKVDLVQNNEALEINLDLLEERRDQAAIREAKSKDKMEKYYNSKVRSASFKPGDLVYRNNNASHAEYTGKLGPKWEGPYKVTKALGNGAYKLRDRDGKQLPRTWNVSNLKKCQIYKM